VNTALKTIILITGSLIFLISCQSSTSETRRTEEKGPYKAKISISAGELFPPFDRQKIPTFFNVGTIDVEGQTKDIIILGKRYSSGKEVSFEPVALLKFQKDTLNMSYLIGVQNTKPANNTGDFFVNNYHLQMSLEQWFKAQGDFNECRNFNWDNTYKALLELD